MEQEEGDEQVEGAHAQLSQPQDGARPKRARQLAQAAGGQPEHPCLACGENCGKNKHSVRCVMCTLWAHKACVKMTDAMFKSLEQQVKEVGTAYWVCRPCQNFGLRVQNQLTEANKLNTETAKRVDENTTRINNSERDILELKKHIRRLEEKIDKGSDTTEDRIYDEMQEREVRRMNLVIHSVAEPPPSVQGQRERKEYDLDTCDEIFATMTARITSSDLRFCRRLGAATADKIRPLVIGLHNEEDKRHLLAKARNLKGSEFEHISIIPDLTVTQRE